MLYPGRCNGCLLVNESGAPFIIGLYVLYFELSYLSSLMIDLCRPGGQYASMVLLSNLNAYC